MSAAISHSPLYLSLWQASSSLEGTTDVRTPSSRLLLKL